MTLFGPNFKFIFLFCNSVWDLELSIFVVWKVVCCFKILYNLKRKIILFENSFHFSQIFWFLDGPNTTVASPNFFMYLIERCWWYKVENPKRLWKRYLCSSFILAAYNRMGWRARLKTKLKYWKIHTCIHFK